MAEIQSAKLDVQKFISLELTNLLEDSVFLELLDGFVPYDQTQRAKMLVQRMKSICLF